MNHSGVSFITLRIFAMLGICAALVSLSGCRATADSLERLSAALLAPNNSPKQVSVNFCTDPAQAETFTSKMVVVLDHSGSNQKNYLMAADGSGTPLISNTGNITISADYATDPTGSLRYGDDVTPGTLLNYLANTPANDPSAPSRFFALVDFSSGAGTYPANGAGFTSDIPDFYQHVKQDSGNGSAPADTGSTSYLAALGAVYNIINSDVVAAAGCAAQPKNAVPTAQCPHPGTRVISAYSIVFATDGSPITAINGVGTDGGGNIIVTGPISVTREPTNQILGQVRAIGALAANTKYVAGINLFTIFYYNQLNNTDTSAQTLLTQMASAGSGVAYSAVSGTKLDYSRFVPPAKTIKYTLSDLFVTNTSVEWDSAANLLLDSDGDGIPDVQEIAFGTDPKLTDTNGNGVSDLVEYRLASGTPCAHKDHSGICSDPANDYAHGACAGIASTNVGGRVFFSMSDPNGLNDCEKLLLGDTGGINNPDSNGDLIPDWLEFRYGVPFQIGTAAAYDSGANDGLTLYQKIKLSLPTVTPLSEVLNLQPAEYDLTLLSSTPVQDCYSLKVTNLPMVGDTNRIRVDVVEKSDLLQEKYLYRTSQKSFLPGQSVLEFKDWNTDASSWGMWQ